LGKQPVKDLESYITEAVDNIREDRATTKSLLMDAIVYLKKNEENHKTTGAVVAKYLETLQRSNDQLVKIASLVHKDQDTNISLTNRDKEELFDLIKDA